eukprot:3977300-Amphidinium_carterae.1
MAMISVARHYFSGSALDLESTHSLYGLLASHACSDTLARPEADRHFLACHMTSAACLAIGTRS